MEGQEPKRRRGRRRKAIAGGLAAVLAGTAVALLVLASRSVGPIETGGGFGSARPVGGALTYREVQDLTGDATRVYVVGAERQGGFRVRFEIENGGRLPLTFEAPEEQEGLVVQTALQISRDVVQDDGDAGADMPLEGAKMAPGERRRLTATFRWRDLCDPEDSEPGSLTTTTPGIELNYSAYGFSRSEFIDLPAPVVLVCGQLPKPDGMWVTRGARSAGRRQGPPTIETPAP